MGTSDAPIGVRVIAARRTRCTHPVTMVRRRPDLDGLRQLRVARLARRPPQGGHPALALEAPPGTALRLAPRQGYRTWRGGGASPCAPRATTTRDRLHTRAE